MLEVDEREAGCEWMALSARWVRCGVVDVDGVMLSAVCGRIGVGCIGGGSGGGGGGGGRAAIEDVGGEGEPRGDATERVVEVGKYDTRMRDGDVEESG